MTLHPELYCLDFVLAWALCLNEACQRTIEALILKQEHIPQQDFIPLSDYEIFLEDQRNDYLFLEERQTEVRSLLLTIKARVEQKPWLAAPIFLPAIELMLNTRLGPHHQKILESLRQSQGAIQEILFDHAKNDALSWLDLKDYLNSRRCGSTVLILFKKLQKEFKTLDPFLKSWLATYPYPFPRFKTGEQS